LLLQSLPTAAQHLNDRSSQNVLLYILASDGPGLYADTELTALGRPSYSCYGWLEFAGLENDGLHQCILILRCLEYILQINSLVITV